MEGTRTYSKLMNDWLNWVIRERWLTRLILLYMLLVLGHSIEHIFQVVQVFVLGWARPEAGGALGLRYPELVRAEILHFSYNLMQLLGLLLLQVAFTGRSRRWWNIAILAQGWHFFEHFLLQAQWLTGIYLFGAAKQTSFGELLLPRVELHFLYVSLVTIPTLIALVLHFRERGTASHSRERASVG